MDGGHMQQPPISPDHISIPSLHPLPPSLIPPHSVSHSANVAPINSPPRTTAPAAPTAPSCLGILPDSDKCNVSQFVQGSENSIRRRRRWQWQGLHWVLGSTRMSSILSSKSFAGVLSRSNWHFLQLLALPWGYFPFVGSLCFYVDWLLHCLDPVAMLQL